MKSSSMRVRLVAALAALVLASVACTSFGADSTPLPPAGTVTPVIVTPTQAPPTETAIPEESSDTEPTLVPVEPTEAETEPTAVPADVATDELAALFAPFWEAWDIVNANFVDQPIDQGQMVQGAIDGMLLVTTLNGQPPDTEMVNTYNQAAGTPDHLQDLFGPFWSVWVQADVPQNAQLMRAGISGMLASLGDQHTSYMDPDQFIQANIPLDGEYEGIGAWVDPDGEYLTIVSPMQGSPAEDAGLRPGDQVIAVDGEDMTGVDGNLVIRSVLGPAGTDVILTIRREETADFDVTITRGRIVIPSVTGEMIEGDIAYVQLFNFGDRTSEDLRTILEDLLAQNPKGLILDLRNNGGGFLVTSIEIASEFIGEGVILYEVYGDGTRDVYDSIPGGVATEIPMVVLINEGSASASEILAGAIQDYGRAPLVGVVSFGKGSVQNWIPLTTEASAVRVTIARWFTPEERLIHEIGLNPDVVVEITEEDIAAGLDPQLDAAIAILNE
jgi:carboxyl-terminal processing protease